MVLITAVVWEDLCISHGQVVCLTAQRAKEVFGIQTGRCGGLLQWAVAPPGSFPAFAVGKINKSVNHGCYDREGIWSHCRWVVGYQQNGIRGMGLMESRLWRIGLLSSPGCMSIAGKGLQTKIP